MVRVGLTGGLASGKSLVGEALVELGCQLIKADELGHQTLEPGGEAYEAAVAAFGRGILDDSGRIDRRLLAAEVFGSPERLALLNRFVHPAVIRKEQEWMAEVEARDPEAIAVVEAAILIETGSYRRFDRLIVTACGEEQQIERAMKRDGITREEAITRMRRQMPLAEKRKYADFLIDTSGSKEETYEQTRRVYAALRAESGSRSAKARGD
jgi:dephospho-CoA kinase